MAIVFFIISLVIGTTMQQLATRQGQQESWYVPNYQADSLMEIDFSRLSAVGVRCVAIDIDQTLVSHGGMELDEATVAFLQKQREEGNIERLAIATNRVTRRNVAPLAKRIGADVIMFSQGWRRKPARAYYEELLGRLGCRGEETAMVGDKLWQDIYGANRAGLVSVLVEPIGPPAWFDWLLLSQWRQRRKLQRAVQGHFRQQEEGGYWPYLRLFLTS